MNIGNREVARFTSYINSKEKKNQFFSGGNFLSLTV